MWATDGRGARLKMVRKQWVGGDSLKKGTTGASWWNWILRRLGGIPPGVGFGDRVQHCLRTLIDHQAVRAWAESLGTDQPMPLPVPC